MDLLDKAAILAADDLETTTVHVPEWGGSVRMRALRGAERDRFEAEVHGGKATNYANMRARLVARSIIDEAGERLFADKEIETLGQKSSAALHRLFMEACRLSRIGKSEVTELEKASGETDSGAQDSESPAS